MAFIPLIVNTAQQIGQFFLGDIAKEESFTGFVGDIATGNIGDILGTLTGKKAQAYKDAEKDLKKFNDKAEEAQEYLSSAIIAIKNTQPLNKVYYVIPVILIALVSGIVILRK